MVEQPTRLLDTSIFVDYLRGNETCKEWLNNSSLNDLAYSIVTAAELLAGCRNRREQDIVEKRHVSHDSNIGRHLSNSLEMVS